MLDGLRPHAFVRRDDEQQHVHPGRAREHVVQKALVPGHVDDPRLDAVVEAQVRETEVERHPAQALFDPAIGIGPRQRADQRRLPVVDVTGGADDVHQRAASSAAASSSSRSGGIVRRSISTRSPSTRATTGGAP